MAYFECTTGIGAGGGATITVTYGSSFYNKTITCSNGTKTYTKTTTSSGSTEFKVSDEGTWTITCENQSVNVSVVLTYSTFVPPKGKTVTPINDVQTWLQCAGISKNYTTLNQVLADSSTLLGLMSNSNAVDYLVRSTNFASDICADSTAMSDIGANDYCAETLLNSTDTTWLNAICASTYCTSVLNIESPLSPSDCGASSTYSGRPAYQAFNNGGNLGNGSTFWLPASAPAYVWYMFPYSDVICRKVRFQIGASSSCAYKIMGSNDGSTWTDVKPSETVAGGSNYFVTYENKPFRNTTKYKYYAFYVEGQYAVAYLKFYGRRNS